MASKTNPFGSEATLKTAGGQVKYHRLSALSDRGLGDVATLPYSIKVLLETCLRNVDNFEVHEQDVSRLAGWDATKVSRHEVPFKPARVILQDFTGVPCVVDLAAMRAAMHRAGGNPHKINPLVPVDLVIDHSFQVDEFGHGLALLHNTQIEFHRNRERYEFLKWGQKAFKNFSVVPPSIGIVHQVNLEYLAKVVAVRDGVALPDSLVGTDSHTTMINGLGVLGWGVGGIEAEACMLGQPIYLVTPEVVGFKLTGELPEGSTATDLVLTITQILRKHGVVEKFVEFYGDGLRSMAVADRATIGNMAPEYGATCGFFPVDEQTIKYLRLTGRDENHIDLVERYCKEQGLWREDGVEPRYSQTLTLDLSQVTPSLAGPRRPQDRVDLRQAKQSFGKAVHDTFKKTYDAQNPPPYKRFAGHMGASSVGGKEGDHSVHSKLTAEDAKEKLTHGDVVIASITSCTNTSNPHVMVAAGLLAKKAVEKGLKIPPFVKTSLAPGSRVVTDYYNKAGLTPYLEALGFHTVGYGCATCIGNSGPLPQTVVSAIEGKDLVSVAVLSGNRNFEGRIHPYVKANYLTSPPLVIAYAIAGSMDMNLFEQPLGLDQAGHEVFLKDIWPTQEEVDAVIQAAVDPQMFRHQYSNVAKGNEQWNEIPVKGGELFEWNQTSTYIQEPPFFDDLSPQPKPIQAIHGARVLVLVGDSVTTDHISPAGSIKKDSPAGKFLLDNNVAQAEFNSYGSRRGNDRVMTRGTFANIRLRNLLAPGTEGGVTTYLPENRVTSIYEAAIEYQKAGTPLVVIAGKDYGMGSSRDWAAKGTMLLGVKAVIADSFERIHRSNLVGMGVLPLQFKPGQNAQTVGLTGWETFDINIDDRLTPGQDVTVVATDPKTGTKKTFLTHCRIDTPVEIEYYRNGGILQTVLRKLMKE
ncbi:MAG: aconitate hydratase AcnA [Phycisphaerales bacterium]|nr:aconitate hydratase AcnA [Phycisphaerales bacterium]